MPGHFTFFCDIIQDNVAIFSDGEYNHIVNVTRYKLGDKVEFTDGKGCLFQGKLVEITKKQCFVEIFDTAIQTSPTLRVAVGVLKNSDRMEWVVEKCTELGVREIVFLGTKNAERSKINLERLTKTAIGAVKQSHSTWLPEIKFTDFVTFIKSDHSQIAGNKAIAYCNIDESRLTQSEGPILSELGYVSQTKDINFQDSEGIKSLESETPRSLRILTLNSLTANDLIVIGPEGDFTEVEIQLALSNGFELLDLGDRILRSETAAIAAVACANRI
jgi:16S rRNA (uracil1498-N3)-methyltransferase